VQGISATDRMDQTIRQTTELGIRRIIPLESERSTVRLDDEARAAKRRRWERVARGAAEQSGQLVLPAIEMPCALPEALALLVTLGCEGLVFFWEEPGGLSLGEALEQLGLVRERPATDGQLRLESQPVFQHEAQPEPQPARQPRLAVFIGPEGGFSEAEATLIRAQGAQVATLGATILRTETAAVVACALILHQLGGLGAR
jgi:16S rRNA (uracil1498-N3)-methyltransferase